VDVVSPDQRRAKFEAIAPALIEPIRRFLARRTDAATADDVLSETLLVIWRRLDDVPADHVPWAYGVARHCLANAHRAQRRQERLLARIRMLDRPSDIGRVSGSLEDQVGEAMGRLRPDEAEVLRLSVWEQLGPTEIGLVLGVSANAVSIRLYRARRNLKTELRKLAPPGGHEESTRGRLP
jgi:RNA polymerase sigma-70 factor (ECF subfamily)